MGKYQRYAEEVLADAFGERWDTNSDTVFSFGKDAGTGEVDGTIDGNIAVEIGVGSPKQIRASVLDLMLHPLPKKMLVLVDTPSHPTERSVMQAATILARAGCSGVVYRLAGNVDTDTHLSETVNKYIGEIEKNLVRVFDGVQHRGSVLLFGEVDLFGRRADSDGTRDRYIGD